ncbi:MAG: MYXO-CTERM sorting domain-containing protein [Pseudomonadota bacterium]
MKTTHLARALTPALILLAGLAVSTTSRAEQAVCVRVKLVIPQRLSFERDAFDASLGLTNNLLDAPLEQLAVEVQFFDMLGNRADDLFFLTTASTSNVSGGLAGAGVIAPEQKGQINWLVIPTLGAGGASPAGQQYKVKAVIDYSVQGIAANIETYEEIITVKPQPELVLDYFLPRKVKGDDPWTDTVVEPSVPFDLAVRVANIGYGEARNLRIVSGQPRIVENRWGLLIDFAIIGTFRNDDSIARTMAIPFGTLAPASCGVGSWAMTTSLQGEFVELDVSFEHSEELGGAKTSLVSATRSHWLVHKIQVDRPGKDSISDLLALVDTDGDDVGDTLRIFESQCGEIDALPAAGSSTGAPDLDDPTALVTATVEYGWSHVTAADPALGALPILRVVRLSDGKVLHWRNSWLDEDDASVPNPLLAIADYATAGPRSESWLVTYDMSEFDQVPPQTGLEFLGPYVSGSPLHVSPTTILRLVATDDLSGVATSEYRKDGGDWLPNGPFYFQVEGAHLLEFYSVDRKGNTETVQSVTVVVDGTAPAISVSGLEAGRSYLTTESPVVGWTTSDLDGDPQVTARVVPAGGGTPIPVSNGQALDLSSWALGAYVLELEAVDWLGNRSTRSVPFLVQSEVGGCVNVPEDGPCDDGNPCTTGDSCQAGVCVAGAPNTCDDANVCTNDSCDPGLGCQHSFNTLPCDDGTACTVDDQCNGAGACVGQALTCDDSNLCTDDSCDPAQGCQYVPNAASCDDGNDCTSGDQCAAGSCVGAALVGAGQGCDDANACTDNDQCDGAGACVGQTLSCDDSNVCTTDSCAPATGCDHVPAAGSCDDGNPCTADDTCAAGTCVGTALASGSDCDDGNPCSGPDHCDDQATCQGAIVVCSNSSACDPGSCCGSSAVDCDDSDPCTADLCLATGSSCEHIALPSCLDAGTTDGSGPDTGTVDAAGMDAATLDAAVPDAGQRDGAVADAARTDREIVDVIAVDRGQVQADAGARRDASTVDKPPADGCGCTGHPVRGSAGFGAVLVLLVLRRRRARS